MLVLVGYKFALAVCRQQMVAVHMYRPGRSQYRQVQDYRLVPGCKLAQDCKLEQVRHNVSLWLQLVQQAYRPDHSYGHFHNHKRCHSGFAR